MPTAYLTHFACLKHDMGAGHPECPARLKAIENQLTASGLLNFLKLHEAPEATVEQLTRVHTNEYVERIFTQSPSSGIIYLDSDTAMNVFSLDSALRAAGAAVEAVNLVISGQAQNAFCSIRPPGHHAEQAAAAGFCIFNNVAIGAAHALRHYGLQRVAIIDFDVHHGNGTEAVFYDDPQVMLCSTFRHPYYPYTGAESGNSHIINVPLAAGSTGTEFRRAVTEHWLPALDRFRPQFLFISAGFDAHYEDSMGGLKLTEADYSWATEFVMAIAKRYANNRIVSTLEGGYALDALGRSVLTHIKSLSGL